MPHGVAQARPEARSPTHAPLGPLVHSRTLTAARLPGVSLSTSPPDAMYCAPLASRPATTSFVVAVPATDGRFGGSRESVCYYADAMRTESVQRRRKEGVPSRSDDGDRQGDRLHATLQDYRLLQGIGPIGPRSGPVAAHRPPIWL